MLKNEPRYSMPASNTTEPMPGSGLPRSQQRFNPVRPPPPPPPPRSHFVLSHSPSPCRAPNHSHDGCVAVIPLETNTLPWPPFIEEALVEQDAWIRRILPGSKLAVHIKAHRQDVIGFFNPERKMGVLVRSNPVNAEMGQRVVDQDGREEEGWMVLDDQVRDEGWVKILYTQREEDDWVDLGPKHPNVFT
ncbi:MAG: hypothetical protein M1830_010203 [Pleopsidium flavum]|nr:MAG: hypothetical protein M1830_010203 [Pleopsidium flavum]